MACWSQQASDDLPFNVLKSLKTPGLSRNVTEGEHQVPTYCHESPSPRPTSLSFISSYLDYPLPLHNPQSNFARVCVTRYAWPSSCPNLTLDTMATLSAAGLRLAYLPGVISQASSRPLLRSKQMIWRPEASSQMSSLQSSKPRLSTLGILCPVYKYLAITA